ncbi:hypothetical protein SEA_Fireman_95 [Microbacterium phage Fireman]|uniref:Uncharacterized protein n=2 Tax=Metamorphoovirus TaxID=2733195 RepID=A0A4P8VYS7_9CAUD|nr:hypothetical protein HOT42_gp62 [Microbacterium phage Metamorphoo]YP_009820297.1 hypothetical protein HOV22_gp62 [Microbacterium phage Fireman]QCS26950.1 hypothetical protein SEA_METAMORPHOO_94 [Microbacterium phage Metamorphoo]QCS26970.1 hypothetical protein SEA_Fireman_95 [Microbacterium phage Fireman]
MRRHPGGRPPLPARMLWGTPLGNGKAAGERLGVAARTGVSGPHSHHRTSNRIAVRTS